jgi:hypothetical protein
LADLVPSKPYTHQLDEVSPSNKAADPVPTEDVLPRNCANPVVRRSIAKMKQEDQQMVSAIASATPKLSAISPPQHLCATGCGARLSHNNTSGFCVRCCQRKEQTKTNGHNKAQPRAAAAPAAPAKTNGEDHHQSNGTRPEARLDLLLAAIPQADKQKMLSAWINGAL